MNILPFVHVGVLNALFSFGVGVRAAARLVGVHRDTASFYRRLWLSDPASIEHRLQIAYDLIWDDPFNDEIDKITGPLPTKDVLKMFDDWMDDSCGREPKSKWY